MARTTKIVVRSRAGRVMVGRPVSNLLSSSVMSVISSPMMCCDMSGPDDDRDWHRDTHTGTNIPRTQSRSGLLTEIKTLKISVDFRDRQFYVKQTYTDGSFGIPNQTLQLEIIILLCKRQQ